MTLQEYLATSGRSLTAIAKEAGVSVGTVSRWKDGHQKPYAEDVPRLSRVLGLPRHVLRPDLYEAPDEAPQPLPGSPQPERAEA